jgi:hypothetical protein
MKRALKLKNGILPKLQEIKAKCKVFKGMFQQIRLKCRYSGLSVPVTARKYDFAPENSQKSPYKCHTARFNGNKYKRGRAFQSAAKSTHEKAQPANLICFTFNLHFLRHYCSTRKSNNFIEI